MAKSPFLQIPLLAPNQASKEVTINDGFSIVERSLNDMRAIDLSAGDVTLNIEDYTRAFLFEFQGHTATRNFTIPASTRLFGVFNSGTAVVTVICDGSAGMTAEIPPASFVVLFNNGVDVRKISDSAASGQVSAFLSLPDTPSSFAGQAGMAMIVNPAEDALTFGTISVSFTQLTDGPNSYTGQAGKGIRVKAAEDGIEFVDYPDRFRKLLDTPADYVGQGNKMVVVNSTEDGVEFQDIPEPVIKDTRPIPLPNGGFEDGNLTNWVVPTSGGVWTVDTGFYTVPPSEGLYLAFHDYGQGDGIAAIGYMIDLLSVAYPEEIDVEAELVVTLAVASQTADFAQMDFEFYDAADNPLGTDSSPPYPLLDVMEDRSYRMPVPVGSRKVLVTAMGIKNPDDSVDPSSTVIAIDNLRADLKLTVGQITDFINLFDTPISYEGHQGKMLVVNAEEDGISFTVAPSVRDRFTDLQDTPADYSGSAGYLVAVNGTEDALILKQLNFKDLGDTPNSYTGGARRLARINPTENGIDYVDHKISAVEDVELTGLADGMVLAYEWATQTWKPTLSGGNPFPSYTGNNGKVLAVNGTEDGVEWVDQAGAGTPTLTINTQAGAYTLVAGDADKTLVRLTAAAPVNLTVPLNATAAIPVGSVVQLRQAGTGQVTVLAEGAVIINTPETTKLRKQHSSASLIKVGTDEWDLIGDLEVLP